MSKDDRKRIQQFLITLSALQRRLKPLEATLPEGNPFADGDRKEVDSLLRSICGLFDESPTGKMRPLMAKFYGFVKLRRIQKRYRQIAAAHGIDIPD